MRGKVPRRVLQGEELHPEFEFEFDPAEAPKGTTHFVTSEFPYQTWLVCKERSTERIVEVRPYDEGMMRWAEDEDRHLLSGPPPAHLFVTFFLSTVLKRLGPGSYEARLEFRDPLSRPRSSSSTDTDWQPPRVWTGVLPTAAFGFVVDEAPLEILRLRVPTRLSLARLRGERVIFVIYTAADSSNLDVVVHHGFAIGFEVQGGGALMLQGEPPEPDGVTQLGSIDPERTGPFRETYHLRVFETPEHGGHLWLPDSSDPDYRVLWSGTFTVDATKAEIEALRK